jgi:hypothetical protein
MCAMKQTAIDMGLALLSSGRVTCRVVLPAAAVVAALSCSEPTEQKEGVAPSPENSASVPPATPANSAASNQPTTTGGGQQAGGNASGAGAASDDGSVADGQQTGGGVEAAGAAGAPPSEGDTDMNEASGAGGVAASNQQPNAASRGGARGTAQADAGTSTAGAVAMDDDAPDDHATDAGAAVDTAPDDDRGPHAPAEGEIVVLYDGNGFGAWEPFEQGQSEVTWLENREEGWMEVVSTGSNHIVTNQQNLHRDVFLHIEFRSPNESADQTGQNRGNSGVYLQSRYEMQVLDSFGRPPELDGCGAIYKVKAPLVNACKPAEEWNVYEIDFTAPAFENGQKVANARITAWLNDELVQNGTEIPGPTQAGVSGEEASPQPLYLQDHQDAVRYRNVWWIHK